MLHSDCTVSQMDKKIEGTEGIKKGSRKIHTTLYTYIFSPPTGVNSGYGTLLHSDCTVCLKWIKGIVEGL